MTDLRRTLQTTTLLVPTFLMTLDLGVLWLAMPEMASSLDAGSTGVLWVNDIYGFVIASLLVLAGGLGDRVGHVRLLRAGAVIFVVASAIAGTAPSVPVLVAGRALLGIAGAAIIPSTLASVSRLAPDGSARARAVASWVTALSAGVAVGPVVGGIVLQWFWWGAVFLVGIPLMLMALAATFSLPRGSTSAASGRLDLPSAPLLMVAVLATVTFVKTLAASGPAQPCPWVAVVAAVLSGWLFVRRQRRLANPLLDVGLFCNRTFSAAIALLFVGLAALQGLNFLVPQYLQVVARAPTIVVGLLLVIPAVGLAGGSQLTPRLTARLGTHMVVGAGAIVALAGLVLVLVATTRAGEVWPVVAGDTLAALGLAPTAVVGTDLAVEAAPAHSEGQASGISQTSYELGLAAGIAVVGSVMVWFYQRTVLADAPAGADPRSVRRAANSFTDAVSTTGGSDPTRGHDALVREGFVSGLHAAVVLSGALVIGLVVAMIVGRLRSAIAT